MYVTLPFVAALVGAVEDREMLVSQVRRPFDRLVAADEDVGLLDLLFRESERAQHVERADQVVLLSGVDVFRNEDRRVVRSLRDVFADVLKGLSLREEIEDLERAREPDREEQRPELLHASSPSSLVMRRSCSFNI